MSAASKNAGDHNPFTKQQINRDKTNTGYMKEDDDL